MHKKHAKNVLDCFLEAILNLRTKFERDAEVDNSILSHFIHTIVPNAPPNIKLENKLIDTTLKYDDDLLTEEELQDNVAKRKLALKNNLREYGFEDMSTVRKSKTPQRDRRTQSAAARRKLSMITLSDELGYGWQRIPGTVKDQVAYFQKLESDDHVWGKAIGTIDASADDVFAWQWAGLNSNEVIIGFVKEEGPAAFRRIVELDNCRSLLYARIKSVAPGVKDRVLAQWLTWRKEDDGSYVVALAPMEDCPATKEVEAMEALIKGDRRAAKAVRAHVRGFWKFAAVAPNVCRFTYVGYGSLGGHIPFMVLNVLVKSTLNAVQIAKDRFLRNGKVVDAEMRAAFPSPPALATLTEEQKALFAKGVALEEGSGVMKWHALKSPSYLVKIMGRYTPPKRGEEHYALGKVTGLVDCSALEAVAWTFNCCSRDRMRISREARDPARLEKEITLHDKLVATIRRTPFPLQDREVVLRYLCASDASGGFVVVCQSVDDKVDYGGTYGAVRAISEAVMRFTPVEGLEGEQCKVSSHQRFRTGGNVPVWAMTKIATRTLLVVNTMRAEFQRDDEIDAANLGRLKKEILDEPQEYTAEEDEILKRGSDSMGGIRDAEFTEYDSPDPMVKMGFTLADGESTIVSRASTIVDAPVEECVAWEIDKTSRENERGYHEYASGRPRRAELVNAHHTLYYHVFLINYYGITPRDFLNRIIWKWSADKSSLTVVYDEVEDPRFPPWKKYIRGSVTGAFVYERLPSIGITAQTKITWTMNVDMKGAIPKALANGRITNSLMYLSTARRKFNKGNEIDLTSRLATEKAMLENINTPYSADETRSLALGMSFFSFFENHKKKKAMRMANPAVTNHAVVSRGDDRGIWGRSDTTVRATKEQVLAYLWTIDLKSRWTGADLERRVLETKSSHRAIRYQAKRGTVFGGITGRPRDMVLDAVWKEQDDGSLMYVEFPTKHELDPNREGNTKRNARSRKLDALSPAARRRSGSKVGLDYRLRSRSSCVVKIRETAPNFCRITLIINLNLGGLIPAFVTATFLKQSLEMAVNLRRYFQEARRMEDYDDEDGKAIGLRLVHPLGSETISEVVQAHSGLKELARQYAWFEVLLKQIVSGRLFFKSSVDTKLVSLSASEARKIGRNLMACLRARKTAEAGLFEWKNQNRSMVELFERHSWVESMILAMSREILKTAPWGLVWRVLTGSGLSVLDMASDIYICTVYLRTDGQEGLGLTLLGMIVLNILMQCVLVIIQNHKKPAEIPKEILIACSGLKPGFDAARVVIARSADHLVVDAKTELAYTKGSEM